MEGLLFFGDTGEDVTDAKRNESGDDLREESARSARKGDAIAAEVGDDQAHHSFADGALPVGTFKVRVVEPATESGDSYQKSNRRYESSDDSRVGFAVMAGHALNRCAEAGEHRDGNTDCEKNGAEQEAIDQMGDEAEPETAIGTSHRRKPVRRYRCRRAE